MRRREIDGGVRFITFSCYHQLPLLRNPKIADMFVERLVDARARTGFRLYAWVVMPEHVHLLLRKPDGGPLGRALSGLKISVSQIVLARWEKLGAPILEKLRLEDGSLRYWQHGGGFDRNVRGETALTKTIRYIHRNPVERALVEKPHDWMWSSVRWWMGKRAGEVECDPLPGPGWDTWRGFV